MALRSRPRHGAKAELLFYIGRGPIQLTGTRFPNESFSFGQMAPCRICHSRAMIPELVFGAQGDHRGLATIATTSSGSRTMTLKEDEDMTYQSVSPYDGKVLKTFEELTDKQLEMALEIAATCF